MEYGLEYRKEWWNHSLEGLGQWALPARSTLGYTNEVILSI